MLATMWPSCGPGGRTANSWWRVRCPLNTRAFLKFFDSRFRCDCGTKRLPAECKLLPKDPTQANEANAYDHNFEGRFCTCDKEEGAVQNCTMAQCSVCEDWYHLEVRRGGAAVDALLG